MTTNTDHTDPTDHIDTALYEARTAQRLYGAYIESGETPSDGIGFLYFLHDRIDKLVREGVGIMMRETHSGDTAEEPDDLIQGL